MYFGLLNVLNNNAIAAINTCVRDYTNPYYKQSYLIRNPVLLGRYWICKHGNVDNSRCHLNKNACLTLFIKGM